MTENKEFIFERVEDKKYIVKYDEEIGVYVVMEIDSECIVATFYNSRHHAESFTKWLNREWTLIPKTVDEICSEMFNNTSSHNKERDNE